MYNLPGPVLFLNTQSCLRFQHRISHIIISICRKCILELSFSLQTRWILQCIFENSYLIIFSYFQPPLPSHPLPSPLTPSPPLSPPPLPSHPLPSSLTPSPPLSPLPSPTALLHGETFEGPIKPGSSGQRERDFSRF